MTTEKDLASFPPRFPNPPLSAIGLRTKFKGKPTDFCVPANAYFPVRPADPRMQQQGRLDRSLFAQRGAGTGRRRQAGGGAVRSTGRLRSGQGRLTQAAPQMVAMPPSNSTFSPIMYDESSLARNSTALATSSAWPKRDAGTMAISWVAHCCTACAGKPSLP
jgi:hypothetical protein